VVAYPSIAALPEVPDCVVIAVPREGVEPWCATARPRALAVPSSTHPDLWKTGRPEYIALQQRIVDVARAAGMRLCGPNSIGFANYGKRALISFFGSLGDGQMDSAPIGYLAVRCAGQCAFQAWRAGCPSAIA